MFVQSLPLEVIQKISAGEVIESPVDCVKELVENSLDAKSSRVDVEIIKGGKRYISVRDNGTGIHRDDMEKVIQRWSTSKIKDVSDLLSITSFGFRGEALYAVAMVSRLVIRSRFFQDQLGIKMRVEDGKVLEKQEIGMQIGTCVEVYDLFYNLPVRLRFLKKEDTERNRIIKLMKEYALSKWDVHFTLTSNGRKVFDLYPCQDVKERVELLFGQKFEERKNSKDGVSVSLYTSLENTRGEIYLFVNSRPVQNRNLLEYIRKTVGHKKVCVCYIDLPAYMVDVNVHPKKREVRIYKERLVKELIRELFKKTPSYFNFVLAQEKASYTPNVEIIGIIDKTLILAKIGDYLYFFDQHLLSERLLYEASGDLIASCKGALKAGDDMSKDAALELVRAWLNFENKEVCPHGRPIYYRLYIGDIYKNLDRRK
jgi:DNA mismatch repair protein MutL